MRGQAPQVSALSPTSNPLPTHSTTVDYSRLLPTHGETILTETTIQTINSLPILLFIIHSPPLPSQPAVSTTSTCVPCIVQYCTVLLYPFLQSSTAPRRVGCYTSTLSSVSSHCRATPQGPATSTHIHSQHLQAPDRHSPAACET